MPKTLSIHFVHIVWSTKNREPFISKPIRPKLNLYIKEKGNEQGILIDTVNGMEEHIHVLIKLKTTQSVAEVTKWIKGASSRWMNKNYPSIERKFEWQEGYGVFSVSPDDVFDVRKYIYNQETHHQKKSFTVEIRALSKSTRRN